MPMLTGIAQPSSSMSRAEAIASAKRLAERARATMKRLEAAAQGTMRETLTLAEVGGTAFAFGLANNYFGKDGAISFFGIPLDLSTAVALHGAAFIGMFGSENGENPASEAGHAHAIANGALASFAYRSGVDVAVALKAKHASAPPQQQIAPRPAAYANGYTPAAYGAGT